MNKIWNIKGNDKTWLYKYVQFHAAGLNLRTVGPWWSDAEFHCIWLLQLNFVWFFVVHIFDRKVRWSMAGHRSWRCHIVTPESPVLVLGDGPVVSSLIGSADGTACGRPLSGDIPYFNCLYDGPTAAAEACITFLAICKQTTILYFDIWTNA